MSIDSKKSLIFLDIDGTLVDKNYKSNYPKLADFINLLQKNRGVVFSINSNRSLNDLLPIAKLFKINGPIIIENGTYIYFQQTKKSVFLLDSDEIKKIKDIKKNVEKEILATFKLNYPNKSVIFQNIDTISGLSTKNIKHDIFILNNKYRKYSISSHIKKVYKNSLVKFDNKELESITIKISKMLKKDDITITFSPIFGNVLMYSNKTSKKKAAKYLYKNYFKQFNIISIGDELNDYKMVKDIGTFYTTNNAQQSVKNVAAYVSKAKYTLGVYEILKNKIGI